MPEFQCVDFTKGFQTIDGRMSEEQPLDFVFNDFYLNYETILASKDDELLPEMSSKTYPRLEYIVLNAKQLLRQSWVRKSGIGSGSSWGLGRKR